MWARNLLFLAFCVAALGAFKSTVFPPEVSRNRPLASGNSDDVRRAAAQVDAAFEAQWQANGLQPAPLAADLTVARRLSLALAGTIPSLEEIRLFEAQPADSRLEWWLSGLLADRRSSDYVAERLARAYVGVDDGPFILFRRRRFVSWLADQLHENRPYDALVRQLIAEDGLWTSKPATNFITVAIKPDSDEDPDPSKLAARVSRAFLGVRIDCAECHDHPFDRWKQTDFQQLAAFFCQTKRTGARGIRDGDGEYQVENHRTGQKETIQPDVPFQQELLPAQGQSRRARLAAWVTSRENQSFSRAAANRAWALLFGRPLVEPIDNIPPQGDAPAALDLLASDFVAHGYDWQRLLRVIAGTKVFRLDSKAAAATPNAEITPEHEAQWAVFPITRLRPEQVVGGLYQSGSLSTLDYQSHILVRLFKALGQNEFIQRYGDGGADEFDPHGGTIPQRLLLMNGDLVQKTTKDDPVANAISRIAALAPDDASAIETTTLAVLTRRPTVIEAEYFSQRLASAPAGERNRRLEDFCWTLLNSTEFSWNH